MNRYCIVLLLGFVCMSYTSKNNENIEDKVKLAAQHYLENSENVGLSIAIINGDKEYTFCFGKICKNKDEKIDTNSMFEIGSITKVFTSLLLAKEIENQTMCLEDNIYSYFPELRAPNEKISLLNLATHSAGLPRLADNFWQTVNDETNPYCNYTQKDLYNYLSHIQLRNQPGVRYLYSNIGASILGEILCKQNNCSYEDLVLKTICLPYNMNSTVVNFKNNIHIATGHSKGKAVANWDFLDATAGQGALRSTIMDMKKFMKLNLYPQNTSLERSILLTQQLHFTDMTSNIHMGLGWHIGNFYGEKYLEHTGGTGGYRSFMGLIPDSRLGVVVLSNSSNAVDKIGMEILKSVQHDQDILLKNKKF